MNGGGLLLLFFLLSFGSVVVFFSSSKSQKRKEMAFDENNRFESHVPRRPIISPRQYISIRDVSVQSPFLFVCLYSPFMCVYHFGSGQSTRSVYPFLSFNVLLAHCSRGHRGMKTLVVESVYAYDSITKPLFIGPSAPVPTIIVFQFNNNNQTRFVDQCFQFLVLPQHPVDPTKGGFLSMHCNYALASVCDSNLSVFSWKFLAHFVDCLANRADMLSIQEIPVCVASTF